MCMKCEVLYPLYLFWTKNWVECSYKIQRPEQMKHNISKIKWLVGSKIQLQNGDVVAAYPKACYFFHKAPFRIHILRSL